MTNIGHSPENSPLLNNNKKVDYLILTDCKGVERIRINIDGLKTAIIRLYEHDNDLQRYKDSIGTLLFTMNEASATEHPFQLETYITEILDLNALYRFFIELTSREVCEFAPFFNQPQKEEL